MALTESTTNHFSVHTVDKFPNRTPYHSGFPIDSIPHIEPLNTDLLRQRQVYQSIVGSINWLATRTRTEILPALTVLTLTAILHILNNTRLQLMLLNILQVQMNIAYFYTQIHLQEYKHSIIYHIIMIMRHTQK